MPGKEKGDFVCDVEYEKQKEKIHTMCVFGSSLKNQLILLFNLFLLLFIGPTALFSTIYEFYCTILVNFYLYLQYFQQKIFSFSKINESQTNPISM